MRIWSQCSALAAVLLISIAFLKPAQSATRHRAPHRAQAASGKVVPQKASESRKLKTASASAKAEPAAARTAKGKRRASQAQAARSEEVGIRHGRSRRNARLRQAVLRTRRHRITLEEPQDQASIPEVPLSRARLALVPPLKGSHESLVRQNTRADADGLERIEDDADLSRLVRARLLVSLPASEQLHVNPSMETNRRYCRPWTSSFLSDLAAAHYQRFKRPLQVNSAVRTVEYQRKLIRINGNAAPAEGDIASPHLTGATIDIGKKGLSLSEVGWMRAFLLPLQQAGKIDVEEEFAQSCFHISVYRSYSPAGSPRTNSAAPLMATKVR